MYRGTVESPPPLDVALPDSLNDNRPGWDVPVYTKLFRKHCYLPEALTQLYGRVDEGESLTVVSAASSIAAEADSLMALHNRNGFDSALNLWGFDINHGAVHTARQAQYKVYAGSRVDYNQLGGITRSLTEYGFAVDPAAEYEGKGGWGHCWLKADAKPVRQGHAVRFEQRDLTEEPGGVNNADLVLANNFLYHLLPRRAVMAAHNLAGMLSDRGVLMLGSIGADRFRNMGLAGAYSDVRFAGWLDMITEDLQADHGLEPVEPVLPDQSVRIFARS